MRKKTIAAMIFALACCLAFAGCAAKQYTVTYDLNYAGSAPFARTAAEGNAPELPAPERESYAFTGWYRDAACTEAYAPAPVTGDLTLYAGWRHTGERVPCALSFDANGGTGETEEIEAFTGDTVTLPSGEGITRAHFVFSGWSSGQEVYAGGSAYEVAGPAAFTAVWKRLYTVSFALGAGTGEAPERMDAAAGSAIQLPEASGAPAGYAFYGWESETGEVFLKGSEMSVTGNAVLTALWAGSYTLRFDGGAGTGAPNPVTAQTGEEITLPAYTGTPQGGYVFTGWWDGERLYAAGEKYSVGAWDAELTAQFKFDGHTVRFLDWDGALIAEEYAVTGASVTPPDMSRYAEFTGWDQDVSGVSKDLTVTARYDRTFTYSNYFTFTKNSAGTGYSVAKSAAGSLLLQDVVIPPTYNGLPVTGITAGGFSGGNLVSVYLPSQLSAIGARAFQNCKQLSRVDYSAACAVTAIGDSAFSGAGLARIQIPASVVTIGDSAFNGCGASTLAFVENSQLARIGRNAFQYCANLTEAMLPEELTELGMNAFYQCLSLRRVFIPAGVAVIPDFCFAQCVALSTVEFAENSRLEKIGSCELPLGGSSFFGAGLVSLTLPASVKRIDRKSFSNCKQLTEVRFSGASLLEDIGEQAFETCYSLSRFNSGTAGTYAFPQSLKSIGTLAFCANVCLTSVSFGEGLLQIGDYAFSAWNKAYYTNEYDEDSGENLKNVYPNGLTEVTLPASLVCLGEQAFFRSNQLAAINVSEGNPNYRSVNGVLYTEGGLELIAVPTGYPGTLAVEAGCERIASYAAYKSTRLAGVTVPISVAAIGAYAFAGSAELASVTFAQGGKLTEIPDYGFVECVKLTAFTLPQTVKRIGEGAFYNCMGLASFTIPEGAALTEIAPFAFGASLGSELKLTAFTLPDSVTAIGTQAFLNASSLASIAISPTSQLASIGYMAFAGSGLTSFYFPASLTTMSSVVNSEGATSSYAFERCKNLTAVTFAENGRLTAIGYGAFHSSGLASISLPPQITTVEDYAFTASKLTSITLPETVSTVGRYAFYDCKSLTSAVVLGPVETLGIHTFSACASLQTVALPETLRAIGNYCFNACPSMQELRLAAAVPPTLGMAVFGSNENLAPPARIVVPKGAGGLYKSRWADYADLIEEAA